MAFRVSRERFEELAESALETLPQEYKGYFTNITIVVEDYPGKTDIEKSGAEGRLLLGLFTGIPYPHKGGFFNIPYPLPDRITLFQKNIETICSSEKELVGQIQATLVHEVGHYFGLSERDLNKHEE